MIDASEMSDIGDAARLNKPCERTGAGDASWLLRLSLLGMMGALFFSTYGFANWLASRRAFVPSFAFGWEHAIPFVPWTIVPYWSIDLLYAASFLFQTRRADLFDHVKRLVTVQLVSVVCFIAWPLRFGFDRPDAGGVAGVLFTLLAGFDKPYNQAPSLHIGLLVVLWAVYARHVRGVALRAAAHLWFAAIGISVLTTWQHHAIDVPTGAALGCLALFLFPLRDAESEPHRRDVAPSVRAPRLALTYAGAAIIAFIAAIACIPGAAGYALLFGWFALALGCVAWIYRQGAPGAFLKSARGQMPVFMRALLAPTIAGAFVNSRLWTRRQTPVRIDARLSIGRAPTTGELRRHRFTALVDLTAEMPRWVSRRAPLDYVAVPQLDLVAPSLDSLRRAMAELERLVGDGHDVLVCCALGLGRSVLCAAAWLAAKNGERDARAALDAVRRLQPRAAWSNDTVAVLQAWIDSRSMPMQEVR